jgi:C-terminal processing protease CtpA/Prc
VINNKIYKKIAFCVIIIFSLSFAACGSESKESYSSDIQINYNADDTINMEEIKNDLDFIKKSIEDIHPEPYNGLTESEFEEKWEELKQEVRKPLKFVEFYFLAQEAMKLTGDRNTSAMLNEDGGVIPLDFTWTFEGAWINKDIDYIKKGDTVLKIGDKSLDKILLGLKYMYPSDNEYWLRALGSELLKDRFTLEKLGLVDNKNRVKVEVVSTDNDNKIAYLKFEDKNLQETDEDLFTFNIMKDKNLGILKMDKCVKTEAFKEILNKFFYEVNNQNIGSVAIDLRNNTGGDISVLQEFFKYVDIDKYYDYSIKLNKSKQAKEKGLKGKSIISKVFGRNKIKIEHDSEELFSGDIFVLTSYKTSNEANDMAVIIRDNNIGKIIGQCTGSSPNRYGDVVELYAPNSGLLFYVSSSTYKRPDEDAVQDTTLRPDVYVQYTQNDIIKDNDPVIKAVCENVK